MFLANYVYNKALNDLNRIPKSGEFFEINSVIKSGDFEPFGHPIIGVEFRSFLDKDRVKEVYSSLGDEIYTYKGRSDKFENLYFPISDVYEDGHEHICISKSDKKIIIFNYEMEEDYEPTILCNSINEFKRKLKVIRGM